MDEVYDKKSLENSLVLLNQELKAQALLLSFPSKIEKIENSKLLSDKTIAIFWKDIKEHLNKYSKVLDEVLSEVTEDFDAKTLNEKIDFIKNIQIEKKEKEIKNIIDEIKKNKKGFVNKFLGFVKK
ncbi:hypothetical protein [Holospora undulata]|uniref:hypothetical protein n=1 Tax=Holospora undulata TaxID=1169117 RepID=UPI00137776B4|nr:hypothetical protein [Holospora undulata]